MDSFKIGPAGGLAPSRNLGTKVMMAGKSMILPRAGFYTTEGFRQEKHSHGFFWSSTFIEDDLLDRDNPLAYAWAFGVGLYGRRNELLEARRDVEPRANGLPIRAVCNKDEISESK